MNDEQTKEWGQLREECPDHPGFFFDPDYECPVCVQEEFGSAIFNHEGTY